MEALGDNNIYNSENMPIDRYIVMPLNQLQENYRELSSFISPSVEVTNRMKLIEQLQLYHAVNPNVDLTLDSVRARVSRNGQPLVEGSIDSVRIAYQQLRNQLQPPRGGRKYRSVRRKSRKSKKSTRRRKR